MLSLDIEWPLPLLPAALQDLSSNGTYVNGERVGKGCSMPLADGDRISLVLSVAPLAEQAWVFHTGDPGAKQPFWGGTAHD